MGLMRGVLKSAALGNADLSGANLSRADLEFAKEVVGAAAATAATTPD